MKCCKTLGSPSEPWSFIYANNSNLSVSFAGLTTNGIMFANTSTGITNNSSLTFVNNNAIVLNGIRTLFYRGGQYIGTLVIGNGGQNLTQNFNFDARFNTLVGIDSGVLMTTGARNTAIGYGTMYEVTSGSNNTAIGNESLYFGGTGNENVAVGSSALYYSTSGRWNTAIGAVSGYNPLVDLVGNKNVFIGYNTSYISGSISGSTIIGNDINLLRNDTIIFGNNKRVGINTNDPLATIHILGNGIFSGDTNDSYVRLHRLSNGRVSTLSGMTGGEIFYNVDRNKIQANHSGSTETLNSTLFTQISTVVVSGTTSETSCLATGSNIIGTKTIRANSARPGKTYILKLSGFMNETSTPTFRVRLKLGGVALFDSGAVNINALGGSNKFFDSEFHITFRTIGSSGSVFSQGYWKYSDNNGAVYNVNGATTTPTTINTTIDNEIDITVQWGTASVSNNVNVIID